MSIINDFVNYLVNEHEVFPNRLLVEDATIVTEYFHHSVDHVMHDRRRNIVLSCRHKVNTKLFSEEIVDSIHMLQMSLSAKVHLRMQVVGPQART